MGRRCVGSVWYNFIKNNRISLPAKYKIFDAVIRSVCCYGCQVWGYELFEDAEKLQRFFIKRLFNLPRNCPTYFLHLETGRGTLFGFALKLHFSYVLNVLLNHSKDRLTYLVAMQVVKNKVSWFQSWLQLAERFNILLDSYPSDIWKQQTNNLLSAVMQNEKEEFLFLAKHAQYHEQFKFLQFNISYMSEKLSLEYKILLFKIRGEMLNLNYKPWLTGTNFTCSLCNLNKIESTFHFIAECPIFNDYRFRYFNKSSLSEQEFVSLINGSNWLNLALYTKYALMYRSMLVAEFNY